MTESPPQYIVYRAAPPELLATTSLVLGFLGFLCLGPLAGVPAIICAHTTQVRARKDADQRVRRGKALAGLILGYLSLFWLIVWYGVLFPDLSGGNQRTYASRVGNNGVNIVCEIIAANANRETHGMSSVWPIKAADFAGMKDYTRVSDSESYFSDLVNSGVVKNFDWSMFAGAGVDSAPTKEAFVRGGHNAWNVIAGLDESTSDDTPFLFSRNLNITVDDLRNASVELEKRLDPGIKPFGGGFVVVVTKGGAMNIIKPDLLRNRSVFLGKTGFTGKNNQHATILKAKGMPGTLGAE